MKVYGGVQLVKETSDPDRCTDPRVSQRISYHCEIGTS